jgi:RNA polymerase sigma-70 factor (ECF subfamily)
MSEDPTDEALLADAQRGDPSAISLLLERHQAQIYRFGLKMCRDPEDAKDVLQDTMLSVARSLPAFRGQAALSTWLYTIARSFCAKRRRRSKFAPEFEHSLDHPKLDSEQLADSAPAPDAALADRQRDQALHAAIDGLSPAYREVLVLRDMEGLPAQEVAQVLGLGVAAVKSRLHRARKAVRDRLKASTDAPSTVSSDCPDIVGLWSAQIEGDISADDCARMQQHLEQCHDCRRDCDLLKRTLTLRCAADSGAAVPEAVQQSVQVALTNLLERRSGRSGSQGGSR